MEKDKWSYECVHHALMYWIYKNEKLVCSIEDREDARRIVAGMNACAGIETEMLEIPNLIDSLVAARTSMLRAHNHELANLCLALAKLLPEKTAEIHGLTTIVENIAVSPDAETKIVWSEK